MTKWLTTSTLRLVGTKIVKPDSNVFDKRIVNKLLNNWFVASLEIGLGLQRERRGLNAHDIHND